MAFNTDDVRIKEIRELTPPSYLIREFPCGQLASTTVHLARTAGHEIIHGLDDRLLVIVGPFADSLPMTSRSLCACISKNREPQSVGKA